MKNHSDIIKNTIYFAKQYKKRFFILFFSTWIQSLINVLFLFIFGIVVDEIIYHRDMEAFIYEVVIIFVLVAGYIVFELIKTAAFWNTQLRFVLDIRKDLIRQVYNAKAHILSKMKSGDVVCAINLDTADFMNVITDNIFEFICNISTLGIAFYLVSLINVKLAVFMAVSVPVTVIVSQILGVKAKRISKELRNHSGNFNSWIFEMIKGMRDIKLFSGEKSVMHFFDKKISKVVQNQEKVMHINITSTIANTFIKLLSELILYCLGAFLIVNGEITIGVFVTVLSLTTLIGNNLSTLSEFFILLQSRSANLERVCEYLNLEVENKQLGYELQVPDGNILFQGISFSYDSKKYILKNITIAISQGERVAIVGKSGAGKTTFINLLLRMYEPTEGSIFVDNQDLCKCSYKSIRKNIGVVQQDILIFDGTIRYNLTLGEDYTEEEIQRACEAAAILDVICSLPFAFETRIGTKGIDLSGGQKQRIAIARILLRNPKIIIFDEATSALDYKAEQEINQAWLNLSANKTSIIIAHRLSTIVNSDKVAVFDNGELVGFGHHKELYSTCRHYQELFSLQYKGGAGYE